MERHFDRELESLKTMLIKMGSLVEESTSKALQAISSGNVTLANSVITTDQRVDDLEVEIDNSVIDLLALQQPLASDLRFIVAAQKINNDLERIGDHAVNLAQSTDLFARMKGSDLMHIPEMAEIARGMLRNALDSFILADVGLATKVMASDDRIDALNKDMGTKVIGLLRKNADPPEYGLELMRISRNLERIADLATNIAEEVIFLKQARIVKHGGDVKL